MKRSAIRKISDKRGRQLAEYRPLIEKLRTLCDNRSELSGDKPDWTSNFQVEAHHLDGRENERLLNVWAIIMLTDEEHRVEQQHLPGCHTKEYLLALVKSIRERQGWHE